MQRPGARVLTAVAAAGTVVVLAVFASMLIRQRSIDVIYGLYLFQNGPSAVGLLWMSRLVLRRQPTNVAGWTLLVIGAVHVLHVVIAAWADVSLVRAGYEAPLAEVAADFVPAELPLAAAIPLWLMGWLWVPAPVLAVTVLLLAFPDGRLPAAGSRRVLVLAATGAVLVMVATGIDGWPTADWTAENPPPIVPILLVPGGLLIAIAAALSAAGLVRRWRRSDVARRQPFRVVGVTVIVFAIVGVVTYPWQQVWVPAILISFNLLIIAYALAITRYRLHDLEPVLGRAAVAAILSGLVAAVYIAIVVGVASLIGQSADNRLLPLLAVAVVALVIEPARRRARRLVDRLLYGRRADRVEVLSRLAAHASTASAADVVGEVTQLLLRSTGAARAEVVLDDQPSPSGPDPALSATVQHHGERFGEVRLYATAATDLVADAPQLLDDVAHALGVVLHNDRLTGRLRGQLEELRASRQRLVEAHDQARRGLERDIHDSVQSRLISLRLRLAALQATASRKGDHLNDEFDELAHEVDVTVRSLRSLARGLYPPILEQSGLTAALQAHARELPVPVSVNANGLGRYPRSVETAAYFACLEAIQNAIRHSGANTISVDFLDDGTNLAFEVRDDGHGFDPSRTQAGTGLANIGDRMSALGGEARIDTSTGQGTCVSGRIPLQAFSDER